MVTRWYLQLAQAKLGSFTLKCPRDRAGNQAFFNRLLPMRLPAVTGASRAGSLTRAGARLVSCWSPISQFRKQHRSARSSTREHRQVGLARAHPDHVHMQRRLRLARGRNGLRRDRHQGWKSVPQTGRGGSASRSPTPTSMRWPMRPSGATTWTHCCAADAVGGLRLVWRWPQSSRSRSRRQTSNSVRLPAVTHGSPDHLAGIARRSRTVILIASSCGDP